MEERRGIARLRGGDLGGVGVLVRRYQDEALRTAYLVTRDRALAEDVVQEAFLRAAERIDQFDRSRPFAPWFLRSVVHAAVKLAVRREREVGIGGPGEGDAGGLFALLADPSEGPEDLAERAERREVVWKALGALSPGQRAALIQRYYLGLSEAEMAAAMVCPTGTVKWRLHAARAALRGHLLPQLPEWSASPGPAARGRDRHVETAREREAT